MELHGPSLGEWLRRGRTRSGLTQEDLARRSGVSVRTISNLEGGRITAPRVSSLRAIAAGLGIETPAELPAPDAPAGGPIREPLTRLLGRDAELARVAERLTDGATRLVTLTGVAGIGKTRLALAVAKAVQGRGVPAWWVPLAAVGRADLVVSAVADAVGAHSATPRAVAERLGARPALLAVDNVEHLRGVGEVVADLLDRLPGAVVLATGRAPLRVPGEQEWPLRPLPIPDGPADLLGSPAAALLVERIRSTVPDFAVTEGNAGLLTEVCRLVDGLPLALELAAAQWRVRGGDAVLRAIRDDPLGLGDADRATPDHASLHSALAATCALLSSTQRDTLRCLAAFRGGWTLDAATAVAPGASTVDDLDRLLALGLVQAAETPTGRRFSMLPTIHALADREAREHRLASASARRHADWMLGWVRELALTSATVPAAVPALDAERDNLRAALSWFDREEPARGLDLALGLYLYWNHQGHHAEGLGWYERLVDRSDDVDARTNALWKSAWLARGLDRLADAETHAARALAESERSADPELRIKALLALGNVIELRRPGSGVDLHRQALAAAERIGARVQVVIAVVHLATTLVDLGDCDEAIRLLRGIEADDLPYQRMGALLNLANALNLRGDHADADAVLLACEPLVAERPGDATTYWRAQRAHARLGVGDADTARDLARLALADDEDDENRHTKEAWLACGDVALADGRADDAEYAYRRVLTGGFHLASPPGRGLVLTGLALACADARTAAAALATVEDLEHQGFAPPPVVRARAAAAHERWRAAAGWADLVADARRHRVDVVATLTGRESR